MCFAHVVHFCVYFHLHFQCVNKLRECCSFYQRFLNYQCVAIGSHEPSNDFQCVASAFQGFRVPKFKKVGKGDERAMCFVSYNSLTLYDKQNLWYSTNSGASNFHKVFQMFVITGSELPFSSDLLWSAIRESAA